MVRPVSYTHFKPICKEQNPFVKEHHLENKFVVMYSGNIGYTHSVECLIEVAKNMQTDNDVKFLMIGEGKKKTDLVAQAEELNLRNITFLPLQDFNVLPYSLASADLGIITLDENVSRVSVPSKTFNLMAVGVPLLVIIHYWLQRILRLKIQNYICDVLLRFLI